MRAILTGLTMLCMVVPAVAGDREWRLDQLEYETRMQRIELDLAQRRQALDAIDARERASRDRSDAILRDLRRGPLNGADSLAPFRRD